MSESMQERIQDLIDSELERFIAAIKPNRFSEEEFYSLWLAQTYYYVSHSGRLLSLAAKGFVKEELKEAFKQHSKEESGHQILAKNDLLELNSKSVGRFPELSETQEFYTYMYNNLEAKPEFIIGYAFALEFIACRFALKFAETVRESFGDNKDSFLVEHGELDQEHTETILNLLQHLDALEFENVIESTRESFRKYTAIYHAIEEELVDVAA